MSLPTCPYCGYEFDSEDIYHNGDTKFPTERDGDWEETKCFSCKKEFKVELSLIPEWKFLNEYDEEIET